MKKLWLWKNFVDGRPEYWAFDNPYPVHPNGDPITLGEPCGYALVMKSETGRFDVPEAEVIAAIKRASDGGEAAPMEVPEGCTPADAMALREGAAQMAEEIHHLRRCLRFYANGEHYTGLIHWEGPSGDDNWLCPPGSEGIFLDERLEFIEKLDEALVEDGSIARETLRSGKFECEPDEEPKVVEGEPEWHIEQQAGGSYVDATDKK